MSVLAISTDGSERVWPLRDTSKPFRLRKSEDFDVPCQNRLAGPVSPGLSERVAESSQPSILENVAKRSFAEFAVSLAIGTSAAFFTAAPLEGALIFAAIAVQMVCTASLRCAGALAAKLQANEETRRIRFGSSYLCPTLFAYLTAANGQALIHELGHAAGANLMFQDANPQITIFPFIGGITRFSTDRLTAWGKRVGRSNAILILTIMGPASTLLVSAVALAVGFAVREKFPELGRYLTSVGRGDFLAHSFYAISALAFPPNLRTHDFVRLRAHGIHPLAAAIFLFAIPFLIARAHQQKQNLILP